VACTKLFVLQQIYQPGLLLPEMLFSEDAARVGQKNKFLWYKSA